MKPYGMKAKSWCNGGPKMGSYCDGLDSNCQHETPKKTGKKRDRQKARKEIRESKEEMITCQ